MGILNLTPDSFSDGGKYNKFNKSIGQISQMIESGANIIDLGGDVSFLLPGVGELEDAAWAPISSIALAYLFGSNTIAGIDFAKEILPFTDILPVATIAWLLQNVYYDSSLSGWLGLSVTKDKPLIPSDMSDISSFKNIKDAVDTEIVKNKNKNDDR